MKSGIIYIATNIKKWQGLCWAKYIPYKYSSRKLAKEYGIGRTAICDIINNRAWKI